MKKFLIASMVLAATTACAQQTPLPQQQETLVYIYGNEQLILKQNITTKADVGEKLGSPDAAGWGGEGLQSWIYYKRPSPYRSQALNITFNSDNIAVSFKILETPK